jgi:hypothetical protein
MILCPRDNRDDVGKE